MTQSSHDQAVSTAPTKQDKNWRQKLAGFVSYYRLPIVSGLLIGTSYIPFPPWALLFCVTPLFVFWMRENSLKKILIGGWVTQFVLNLIGFHWIAYTASEFGHFPWVFGILVLIAFAATAHLHYPLAGWLSRLIQKRFGVGRGADLVLMVCLFGLCDHFMPMIFPWHLGYPWLWAKLPGYQFADVIGFEGLYFFTLLSNAFFAWAILEGLSLKSREKKPWILAGIAVGIFIVLNLLGLGRAAFWQKTDAELSVLVAQGNIGNFEKLESELGSNFGGPVVRKYNELSREGLSKFGKPQLMLWPETAFPGVLDSFNSASTLYSMVRGFVEENRVPLLTGGYSRQLQGNAVFNGLFYFNSNGNQTQPPYHKSILLVFGETFPFSDYIPYVEKLFPNQGSFGRGPGPQLINIETMASSSPMNVRIGPQICYEGLYPWHSSGLAKLGAQIFVNVTNDSWFWWPFEPHQHLFMTLARGIEFRRPLLRSTNTGISTGILADGTLLEKSPMGAEWTGLFKIPFKTNPPHTLYEKYGWTWTWCLALSAVLLVVFGRKRRAKDGETTP